MEEGWGEGAYPRGQAIFLDSPGSDCIRGEAAAPLEGRPPSPGKTNPVLGLAGPRVTSQRPPLCLAWQVGEGPGCYQRGGTALGLDDVAVLGSRRALVVTVLRPSL